jgi:hypothetical protein
MGDLASEAPRGGQYTHIQLLNAFARSDKRSIQLCTPSTPPLPLSPTLLSFRLWYARDSQNVGWPAVNRSHTDCYAPQATASRSLFVPSHQCAFLLSLLLAPEVQLRTWRLQYNREQYLLTPSAQGDLCVARLMCPDITKSKGGKDHPPIKCEASRQLKWNITNTGRVMPT